MILADKIVRLRKKNGWQAMKPALPALSWLLTVAFISRASAATPKRRCASRSPAWKMSRS